MSNRIITNKFKELLLPSIFIAMALNITSIIDTSFISLFIGTNGQAALQVLEPLIMTISVFELLFGLGGQILSLNRKAKFDEEGSNLYFTVAMLTTLIISIIIILICFLFENGLINLLGTPTSIIPYVKEYGTYLFITFPIVTTLGVLCQYIRVDGQPKFALGIIIFANIINLSLDYLFLGVFHTGIEGASLAMLIGYLLGAICTLKYYFDSKRTFKMSLSKLKIKIWTKSTIEIIKIGLPSAMMGIFDVILIYIMNIILNGTLGKIGLNIFNVCTISLLIISIIVVGFAETLSSIVPIYYSQNDYYNLKHIIHKSVKATIICSLLFTIILLIYPDGLLMFFNLDKGPNDLLIENALRIYSLSFVPMAFSSILIFYYEGIERALESGIVSSISALIGPLIFTLILYPFIGTSSVWASYPLGFSLSIVAVAIYIKIIQSRKEKEYSGLYFFKKGLIDKTKNYTLKTKNDNVKNEMYNHLKSLNVDSSYLKTLNKIINTIFDSNQKNIEIEILIIDYDDKITINMKDEGEREIMKNIEKSFSDEKIQISEVLGFNNIEYSILKT